MKDSISPEDVRIICSKTARQRTPVEIQYLAELTSNLKVFKSLNESQGPYSHIICCRYLKYEYCEQNNYLFKYGDIGTRFYIIVSGKVAVEVPMKNNKGETQMVEVMVLNNGAAFGELALESSKPRAASIKCKTPTHLMYLEKADYNRLISRLIADKRNSLVAFIQSLPLFSHLTKGNLTKLSYIFKEKIYSKGQFVYNENDEADEVFIVKNGEFEFFRSISVKLSWSLKGVRKSFLTKTKKVANLGIGEMFGELEMFENIPRKDTCKCVSTTATIFAISKSEFFKQLNSEEITLIIKHRMIEKEQAIQERIKLLKNIEEGELHRNHTKRSSEDMGYNREEIIIRHRMSVDSTAKDSNTQLKRKKTLYLQKTITKEKLKDNKTGYMGLKSKTFRHKLKNIEKFIPKSLNHKMFESQTMFNVLSNASLKKK